MRFLCVEKKSVRSVGVDDQRMMMMMMMMMIVLYISSPLVEFLSDNETNNFNETLQG